MMFFSKLDTMHALATLLMQKGEFYYHITHTILGRFTTTLLCQRTQLGYHASPVRIFGLFYCTLDKLLFMTARKRELLAPGGKGKDKT